MKYVILSSKPWNIDLSIRLQDKLNGEFIPITSPEEFTKATLDEIQPRYIFIPHWSHIIVKDIYNNYECVVFHMTDLPFGRGGSPLQNLIVREISETKISAIRVNEGLDTGPVYLKKPLSLSGSAQSIFERSDKIIEEMIVEIVEQKMTPVPQVGEPTVFKRRTPDQSNIAELIDTEKVYDYIRMLDAEGYPHAFLETDGMKFEFRNAVKNEDGSINAHVRIIKK